MSDEHHNVPDQDDIHPFAKKMMFLADPRVVNNFLWFVAIGLGMMIVAGLLYPFDDYHKAPWDFFASWGVIGFVSYSFLVLMAEPLFKLLARPETFYGENTEAENIMGKDVPAKDNLDQEGGHD